MPNGIVNQLAHQLINGVTPPQRTTHQKERGKQDSKPCPVPRHCISGKRRRGRYQCCANALCGLHCCAGNQKNVRRLRQPLFAR